MRKITVNPPASWAVKLEAALYAKQQPASATAVKKLLATAAKQLQQAPDANVAEFVGAVMWNLIRVP